MLLEFRVRNFRSIWGEQVLSMVASKDKSHADTHLIETGIKSIPYVLKSAVIYGANAAGKSNILDALAFFVQFVSKQKAYRDDIDLNSFSRFRFAEDSNISSSEFEMSFIKDGVRYQYGFIVSKEKVLKEWLWVYRSAKPQKWFTRTYKLDMEYDYQFSSYFTESKNQFIKVTKDDSLFLSTAALLENKQLEPIYDYILKSIYPLAPKSSFNMYSYTMDDPGIAIKFFRDKKLAQFTERLLRASDTCISSIGIEERDEVWDDNKNHNALSIAHDKSGKRKVPIFFHSGRNATVKFELEEESLGTRRLFALSAHLFACLEFGFLVVIDELDSSFHPLILRELIALINSSSNNSSAQLIFTTHDTSLLDNDIFRRDQIWFVEKDQDGATQLYSLLDFSPRKDEALEKGYLQGRYGAVPMLGTFKLSEE